MASTIDDLSEYGNVKGRDLYSRNIFQSVKGDGTNASTLNQSYYGIESSTTTEYELARVDVTEGAVDDMIGTYSVSVNDGTTVNTLLTLNETSSQIVSTTLTLTSTDVEVTGTVHTSTIENDAAGEGVRISLNDDIADPTLEFILGDLNGTPTTVLSINETEVDVTGTLNVNGTDILATIVNGNAWQINGTVAELKSAYTSVEVNLDGNAYTTSIALDVNGSIATRGNNYYVYDSTGTANLSALNFDDTNNVLNLRTSLADQSGNGDALKIQTTNGTNNTYLDRLTFDGGLGTQNATFSNVNVGIGATPSGTYTLEVVGDTSITGATTVVGNVDLSGNDLVNVSDIAGPTGLAEAATITLTSDAAEAQIDFIVGTTVPVTSLTLTDDAATVNVPTTINDSLIVTGDFTVSGTTTTINTSEVVVEDIAIDLGSNATTSLEIDGGGFILGKDVTGITTPSILYDQTNVRWNSSVDVNVPTTNKITVGDTDAALSAAGLEMNSDAAVIYLGTNKQWRIGITNDGVDDHLIFSHDDLGTQTTWVTKLDVMQ